MLLNFFKLNILFFFFNVPFFFSIISKISIFLIFLIKIVCILIAVAYFTIAERKIMASIQRRRGPNVEGGSFGLLQPLADGLKLFLKEIIIPGRANIFIYFLAPILVFTLSLIGWYLIPFNLENDFFYVTKGELYFYINTSISNNDSIFSTFFFLDNFSNNFEIFFKEKSNNSNSLIFNSQFGILLLLAISSLNVYGIILSGWASNSKYAFLGALRSAAQMISYEVSIGLTILPVIILSRSFNLLDMVLMQKKTIWFCFPLLPCAIIFLISMLAETNRAPFDLPEAEAELVAGYNVEYSGMLFALFFLGEYSSMLLMASLGVILFFGGWDIPFFEIPNFLNFLHLFSFALKISLFCFFYIIVRATFPRYRYDQLMAIGWKIFLPFSLMFFIFTASFFAALNFNFVNFYEIYTICI